MKHTYVIEGQRYESLPTISHQLREHAVVCSLHHVSTWRPDGRCEVCERES